jgi:hypothetical protein
LIHRFIVHRIGGTEEGSAHHGEREGAVDVEGIPGSRGTPVLRVHGVGVFAQQRRLPRRPRQLQLRDGDGVRAARPPRAAARWLLDGTSDAGSKGRLRVFHGRSPHPPFLLPLLPPFSGGGEIGEKFPMGGGTGRGAAVWPYRAALGFVV